MKIEKILKEVEKEVGHKLHLHYVGNVTSIGCEVGYNKLDKISDILAKKFDCDCELDPCTIYLYNVDCKYFKPTK